MNSTNCGCTPSCTVKSVVAALIIGVLTAFLRFTATITITPAFLWVVFGVAIGYLGITLLAPFDSGSGRDDCCKNINTFLAGLLGTVLTSLVLLGIPFTATSVIGAIITGVLLFFFSLAIISSACLIKCKYNCN